MSKGLKDYYTLALSLGCARDQAKRFISVPEPLAAPKSDEGGSLAAS